MASRNSRDNTGVLAPAFTVTNYSESLSLSGTETTAADIALVLTNVIKQLIEQGTLNGSVA